MAAYEAEVRNAGFTDVVAQDLRGKATEMHERELTAFTAGREAFITDFHEDQYDAITDLWSKKVTSVPPPTIISTSHTQSHVMNYYKL